MEKDIFLHAEETVTGICEQAMKTKYGENPPPFIEERLQQEYQVIGQRKLWKLYWIAALFAKHCRESGYLYQNRGDVGASFAAYLLGITEIDPLPPHWQCPKCRYVVLAEQTENGSGFDWPNPEVPQKTCSFCGKKLKGDGQDLLFCNFAGTKGEGTPLFGFNVPEEAEKEMNVCLQQLKEKAVAADHDYAPVFTKIYIRTRPELSQIMRMQRESSTPVSAVSFADVDVAGFFAEKTLERMPFEMDLVRDMAGSVHPACFSDLVRMFGWSCGTGTWKGNGNRLVREHIPKKDIIAFADDMEQYMVRHGLPSEESCRLAEAVRNGQAACYLTPETEQHLKAAGIEDWYLDSMKKIKYLSPKAQAVSYTMSLVQLIWYQQHYPEVFWGECEYIDDADSAEFVIRDSVLEKYQGTEKEVFVPSRVHEIAASAFADCDTIERVDIPETVRKIELSAFENCSHLREVIVRGNIFDMGPCAFAGCKELQHFTALGAAFDIAMAIFGGCEKLTDITFSSANRNCIAEKGMVLSKDGETLYAYPAASGTVKIPEKITDIAEGAFWNCGTLECVRIHEKVMHISHSAFSGCAACSRIEVDEKNEKYASEGGLLLNKNKTAVLTCMEGAKAVSIPESVTKIDDWAFASCKHLKEVYIPGTVTEIGENAFSDCPGIVICGDENSRAEAYAKEYQIPFRRK